MTLKTELIIHASDTRPEWMASATLEAIRDEIKRWHVVDRGWRDIGYNFIIGRCGNIIGGRDLDDDGDFAEEMGAHVIGHNRGTIGVCLIGGHGGAATDKFEDHYTPEQERTLRALIRNMNDRFGDLKISGHNRYANKACPCFQVSDWLEGKAPKPERNSVMNTSTVKSNMIIKAATVAAPAVGLAADMPWKNLLILAALAAIVLVASGWIDLERFKKFNRGDR